MPAARKRHRYRLRVDSANRICFQRRAQIRAGIQRFQVQRVGDHEPAVLAEALG